MHPPSPPPFSARSLSTHLSTAALDKAPQSQARGITLDLGFSAFYLPPPPHLSPTYSLIQYTLVDCPGHSSLIRTLIGASHIIDLYLLILDSTKGIQPQTAECLVLASLLPHPTLIVALNKGDLLPLPAQRERLVKGLRGTFKATRFGADVPMVFTSCGGGGGGGGEGVGVGVDGVEGLVRVLGGEVRVPKREVDAPFWMAIDHCFVIKGQGTVLTGTILTGSVQVGGSVYLPMVGLVRKVKSIEVFHVGVERAVAGERAALCVVGLEAEKVERGIACDESCVERAQQVVVSVQKVSFYKEEVSTGQQMHISVGHDTHVATCTFFSPPPSPSSPSPASSPTTPLTFDAALPYLSLPSLPPSHPCLALLTFSQPIPLPTHFSPTIIASHLNAHYTGRSCRLAFHAQRVGRLREGERVRLYKEKRKEGRVERVKEGGGEVIGKGIWKGVEEVSRWVGFRVQVEGEGWGRIEGGFGKGGKFRVRMEGRRGEEVKESKEAKDEEGAAAEVSGDGGSSSAGGKAIVLSYRQFVDEHGKKVMSQT